MNKLFQYLVITSILLQAIWYFLPYSWGYIYTEEQLTLLSWHGHESYFDIYGPLPYLITSLYLVAFIGLFIFKKWGRNLFLALTVFTIFPIWGFLVSPAIDGSIGYLISLVDGAILSIAYLTTVSNEFT
jgi:hypothetical protein